MEEREREREVHSDHMTDGILIEYKAKCRRIQKICSFKGNVFFFFFLFKSNQTVLLN